MSNYNTWTVESDNLDVEELSDAELSDVQGGFSIGDVQNITQLNQQIIAGGFNVGNLQNSSQSANQGIF